MGQLGDGTTTDRTAPTPVLALGRAVALAVGGNHGCALREDGVVLCWGENLEGQLGDGTVSKPLGYRTVPQPVADLAGVEGLWAGWAHTCARTSEGMRCWGRNDSLQLGAEGRGSANAAITTPRPMAGAAGATALALGARYSCAVLPGEPSSEDAAVGFARIHCLGLDHRGQLGNGARRLQRTFTPVALAAVPAVVEAGVQHTCAVDTEGGVWCWGDDRADQVGEGRHRLVAEPRPIALPGE